MNDTTEWCICCIDERYSWFVRETRPYMEIMQVSKNTCELPEQ